MGVKLVDNIPKIIPALKEQVAQGINNAAQFWVSEAQDLCPVDTGFTKEHIGQTVAAGMNSLSAEVRSLSPYSGYINYGTIKMPAQPFWTVAGLLTKEKFKEFIMSRGSSAGGGVIKAAMMDYFGPMGRKGKGF